MDDRISKRRLSLGNQFEPSSLKEERQIQIQNEEYISLVSTGSGKTITGTNKSSLVNSRNESMIITVVGSAAERVPSYGERPSSNKFTVGEIEDYGDVLSTNERPTPYKKQSVVFVNDEDENQTVEQLREKIKDLERRLVSCSRPTHSQQLSIIWCTCCGIWVLIVFVYILTQINFQQCF